MTYENTEHADKVTGIEGTHGSCRSRREFLFGWKCAVRSVDNLTAIIGHYWLVKVTARKNEVEEELRYGSN